MSFFPSFAPLASVPHSFSTYCSLNGRPGAIKAKLHLGSLECLSRLDLLRSSSNMKYSLARGEKTSKHKSNVEACWTFQSTWVNSTFQGVFWPTRATVVTRSYSWQGLDWKSLISARHRSVLPTERDYLNSNSGTVITGLEKVHQCRQWQLSLAVTTASNHYSIARF